MNDKINNRKEKNTLLKTVDLWSSDPILPQTCDAKWHFLQKKTYQTRIAALMPIMVNLLEEDFGHIRGDSSEWIVFHIGHEQPSTSMYIRSSIEAPAALVGSPATILRGLATWSCALAIRWWLDTSVKYLRQCKHATGAMNCSLHIPNLLWCNEESIFLKDRQFNQLSWWLTMTSGYTKYI